MFGSINPFGPSLYNTQSSPYDFNLPGVSPLSLGGFGAPVGQNTDLNRALQDTQIAQSFSPSRTSQLLGDLAVGTSWMEQNPDPLDSPEFAQAQNLLYGRPQVGRDKPSGNPFVGSPGLGLNPLGLNAGLGNLGINSPLGLLLGLNGLGGLGGGIGGLNTLF